MVNTILKVMVGSHAHGLATSESDWDYRSIFVTPTRDILSLGSTPKETNWIEHQRGEEKPDDTSWEVGKCLFLATKCNPTILEVFLAPIEADTEWGLELRSLFPFVWNSKGVRDAFGGYGLNQRKKFLDNSDNRAPKYAAAYLRTLYNAEELLRTGTFTVRIADTPIGPTVRKFKDGDFTYGEVIQACTDQEKRLVDALNDCPKHEANSAPVNDFLLRLRKAMW